MRENEKFDRLDRNLCQRLYKKELYDSLFDPTKLQNLKFGSKFYASQLFELECFVDELQSNDETPFVQCFGNGGRKEYAHASLASQYFGLMPDFIDVVNMLSPRYDYNERVNAFITGCRSMGLLSERLKWNNIYVDPKITYPRFDGASAAEIFNTLVKNIRSEWKKKNIQAKVNARKKDAIERHVAYSKYVDSLYDDGCASLMVLRINLGYKEQSANSINILDIRKDLNHLFEYKHSNSIFDFMKGYIAKLKYDVDKGIYWHVLFFFDGSKRNNSSHIHSAENIGEYWETTITKGRGDYWKINDNAYHYDAGRRGIWVINLSDAELRKNLKEFVVGDLCKVDQFIKPKLGKRVKLIRRGNFPKKIVKKRGRPRKQVA